MIVQFQVGLMQWRAFVGWLVSPCHACESYCLLRQSSQLAMNFFGLWEITQDRYRMFLQDSWFATHEIDLLKCGVVWVAIQRWACCSVLGPCGMSVCQRISQCFWCCENWISLYLSSFRSVSLYYVIGVSFRPFKWCGLTDIQVVN